MDENERLIALAKSLKLISANNTDAALSKKLIVDAMVSGRVVITVKQKDRCLFVRCMRKKVARPVIP